MFKIANALRMGIATVAVAAATSALTIAPAQAAPIESAPTGSVGSSVSDPVVPFWLEEGHNNGGSKKVAAAPSGPSTFARASVVAPPTFPDPAPLPFYFGPRRDNGPVPIFSFSFNPIALLPGFIRPLFGFFTALDFEACVGGRGLKVGPYGTVTISLAFSC